MRLAAEQFRVPAAAPFAIRLQCSVGRRVSSWLTPPVVGHAKSISHCGASANSDAESTLQV